ncbi:MAG TPA: hypothetical protein VHP33_31855 [Polyangiaceae bacterium]|nr:hypothetical protein [Polyangiaceae bacterium]
MGRFTPTKPLRRLSTSLWLAVAASALLALACGGKGATADREPAPAPAPEQVWLDRVGGGQAQTARVCAKGARDRVAQALCASPTPAISGLQELYGALRLASPDERRLAATTHSLSLSGRSVSAVNPRVMVVANNSVVGGLSYEGVVATAFARGEQLVELVALDPVTYEYNFYLLRFAQPCNASRCSPEDLLSERVETGWTDWTLYVDSDLENTPFDCLSCHRPFGGDTHKLLLMRQDLDPWMHWSDFRVFDESLCPTSPPEGVTPKVIATSDGLDLLASLAGEQATYAGIPLDELLATKSGDVLSDFLVDAENLIVDSPLPPHPYAQLSLRTRETLCERFYTGQSPSWEADRLTSRARGLPFPYYGPEVLDPAARSALLSDSANFWARHQEEDPFDLLAGMLGADVPTAVGFVPRESDTAPEILQGMCGRCHAADVNPALSRSRFSAEATDSVDPRTFREVRARLSLPPTSPDAMPPRRAGYLPDWAVERVLDHLAAHCSEPGACR